MAKIGLSKGSEKRLKVREKSVKSQGILKWILSGNSVRGRGTDHRHLHDSKIKQPALFLSYMIAKLEIRKNQSKHTKKVAYLNL